MLKWPPKHHLAPKVYGLDWGTRYPNDELASAEFTVQSGQVEIAQQGKAGSVANVRLEGGLSSAQNALLGKPAHRVVITCAIVTASGERDAVDVTLDIL